MPRPINASLSIVPPHVEPFTCTLTKFGTYPGVTADQYFALFTINQGAGPILRPDCEDTAAVQIPQIDAAFDLRLDDVVINFIAQVRAGSK